MSTTQYILGLFEDPDDLMQGLDQLQKNNIAIYDVFSPMPIHGIEDKLGLKRSRLPVVAFIFGCIGCISAFSMIYYMVVYDWPMNIGGKPYFAIPDFVPICFEWTVLFSAFGMALTFFYANHLFPGRAPRVMDFRASNDCFVLAIDARLNQQHDHIAHILKEAGAVAIKHNNYQYLSYE